MIQIAGAVRRAFAFPADLPTAWAFYSDFGRVADYLPHIHTVKVYSPHQFRMLYSTTELGIYRVRIYCDLEARFEPKTHTLRVVPLNTHAPAESGVTANSLTAQGHYTSRSAFRAVGKHTRVEYALELKAILPTPLGLNFMPPTVLQRIARNITRWRIHEIADGFIKRSIEAFEAVQQSRRHRSMT